MSIRPSADSPCTELVHGIRVRDPQAESDLYARFGARIWYLAFRELRARDQADDVRSEALLRVLVAVREGRLRTPEALPGFVLQTARNVIHEMWRSGRRTVSLDAGAGGVPEPSTETAFADEPQKRALERAMQGLSPRDQAVLRLCYYEDLSREEIAQHLGVMSERVRLVKSRALARFRAAYAEITRR